MTLNETVSMRQPASGAAVEIEPMRWWRRIVTKDEIAAYPAADYWEIFVLKHRHPANLAFHWVSFMMLYGSPILALATWNAWWLFCVPLSSVVGVIGHCLFEDSSVDFRDTVYNPQTMRCLNRMFYRMATGRYAQDVALMTSRLHEYQTQQT